MPENVAARAITALSAVRRTVLDEVGRTAGLIDRWGSATDHFRQRVKRLTGNPVEIVETDTPHELASRAARAGKSLQEYVRGMLMDTVARPCAEDVIARARARVTTTGSRVDAESILAARDADRR